MVDGTRSILWNYNLLICNNHNPKYGHMVTPYFHTLGIWQKVWCSLQRERSSQECMHSRENLTSFLGSFKGGGEKHEGSAGWKMSIQVPCLQNFHFSYEKKFLLVLSGLQMFTHKLLGRSLYRLELSNLEAFTSTSTMWVSISYVGLSAGAGVSQRWVCRQ